MGTINFDLNFWTLTLLVLNFGLALFVAITNRGKAAQDELSAIKSSLQGDIKKLDEKVSLHGQKLATIEADVENGITKEDLSVVHRRIDQVLEKVGPMHGHMAEMSKSLDRMDQHIMQLINRASL